MVPTVETQRSRSYRVADKSSARPGRKQPNNKRILCIPHTVEHNYISPSKQYSRDTTTCFGTICGPSSGCDLTYRAAIQDVWGVLCGYWGLGGGNEISFF